jgi:hypothetical protein
MLYFLVESPMLGPWGPLSMMYPTFPPWAGGMGHGRHRQCISTRDGQDLLRVLTMESTRQEMAIMDVSTTRRTGGPRDTKTG